MGRHAPNGELVAQYVYRREWDNAALTIRDLTTDRLAQVFNPHQVLLSLPHRKDPLILGAPTWLCNSSGLLINIEPAFDNYSTHADTTENTIWQVGINGEVSAIARGAAVVANSQDGRYWLLTQGKYWYEQQFYLMTVDDTALEE